MKYQIFKAVDKLDGDTSIFVFDEEDNYTVIYDVPGVLDRLVEGIRNGNGCDWSADSCKYPRRNDMVKPVLLCEVNV